MSIYTINTIIAQTIAAAIDPETGEILNDDLMARLDQLQIEKNELILELGCELVNTTSLIEAIKQQERILKDRKARLEAHYGSIEKAIRHELPEGEKLKDGRVELSWLKSSSVEVQDVNTLAKLKPGLVRVKTTVEADKKAIKDLLRKGKEIQGCSLVDKMNLQVK